LDITLPEATRIALTLHDALPTLRTATLNLTELEDELGHVLLQEKNTETV
jgi:hypothetical protein